MNICFTELAINDAVIFITLSHSRVWVRGFDEMLIHLVHDFPKGSDANMIPHS